MSTKVKLTPKDCLYIDDALSQLCAIKQRICSEKKNVTDEKATALMEEVENTFTSQYDEIRNLLKEASK